MLNDMNADELQELSGETKTRPPGQPTAFGKPGPLSPPRGAASRSLGANPDRISASRLGLAVGDAYALARL
jgi:hypothetical protein